MSFDLRLARMATGKNQDELARAARLPRWKITFAETNRRALTGDELVRVKDVLAKQLEDNDRELRQALQEATA
jgi:hypothetical protein